MKIIRYHNSPVYRPAVSHANLQNQLDRFFADTFSSLSSFQNEERSQFPIDLYQDKDAYVVRAELPGFRKEDLHLDVADGVLTVTGHQKTETKTDSDEKTAIAQERKVSRSVSLPDHVQFDKIAATYENGVLTVTLPKQEEVKPRPIAIEVK